MIIIYLLIAGVQSGLIAPYLRKPIEPSVNNELEMADYTFTFTTSTDLFNGDQLLIKFPTQYTSLPITQTTYQIKIERWNVNHFIWDQINGATCVYIPGVTFKIQVPDLKAANYRVTINNINNPSFGGTGNFVIETRRNAAYLIDINLVDYNYAFGQIGLLKQPTDLGSVSVSQTFGGVNNVNTYTITFTTIQIIPQAGKFVADFSSALFTLQDTFVITSTFTANITRVGMVFTIDGFNTDVAAGNYQIKLENIKNPTYAGIPGTITLRSWNSYTNTILNQKKALALPTISPGQLSVTIKAHNFLGISEIISINDLTQYQIQFTLINAIEKEGQIIINWGSGGVSKCIVYSGLYDQDENNMVQCTISSGSDMKIKNFKRVQAKTVITIQFEATNPGSGSLSNLKINTYQDQTTTKQVDTYDSSTGLSLQSIIQLTYFDVTFPTANDQRASQTATWSIKFYHSVAFVAGGSIIIKLPSEFSLSTPSCSATTQGGASDTGGSCSVSGLTITYALGSQAASFSTTAANTLTITNIKHPSTPGLYPISVNFLNGGSLIGRKTHYLDVWPYKLTPITTFRLSSDQSTQTLFHFTFPAMQDIPSSQYQADYAVTTSEIWVEFETNNNQFPIDLGTGLADGTTFPCYGYLQLQALDGNSEIQCTFVKPSASPTPARIRVHHYKQVLMNQQFQIHLPNIQNPKCLNVLVTVDVPCPTSSHATIKILLTKNRRQYILYQNDVADIVLTPVLPNIVVKNPKNDNLVGGLPSQASPKFIPSAINKESIIQIRYEPGLNKYLTTSTTNHMIFIFPQLPTTNPMAYIVNKQVTCSIGLQLTQTCYAYREVGWVVIIGVNQNLPPTGALDTTFYLKKFVNPFYAADPVGYIQLYTIRNGQQYERTIFQDLANFSPGGTGDVTVSARRLEANMIDVEYNWLFSFNDDIPAGGLISMIYAVNFYNVQQSDPKPQFVVKLGLESTTGSFSQTDATQNTNIYTITNFKPYTAGTLISIKMTGVKNPPESGLTNYFGVQSQTKELFTIGQKTDVDPKTIIRSLSQGEIIFNYFKMTPDNGSPTGKVFPANYEVSFYTTRTIPKYGQIEITFPATEFADSSAFLNSPLRCYTSGSLKTFQSCALVGTTNVILITLDAELRIEAGMDPIIVSIPNVKNFAEDLNSGVIRVRTLYDAVTLDDSGTTEENRKATSGLAANFLDAANYSMTFLPTTEGELANYEIKLIPTLNIADTAKIVVEFTLDFPYGLGGNVDCQIPLLAKADNDPILSEIQGRQVHISNIKAFTTTTDGFVMTITGVQNPNKGTYSNGIRVYIMKTSEHAQEYVASLGAMTFTQAAPVLYMPILDIASKSTREYSDYIIELQSDQSASFSTFKLNFQSGYQIAELWSTKSLVNQLDSQTIKVEPNQNSFQFSGTFSITSTSKWNLTIQQLPNPLDEGIQPGYPDVSLYDNSTKTIKLKTYWNIMQPITPNFTHAGNLIIIADDNPNFYIEAGTYTNEILLSLKPSTPSSQTISISPEFDSSFSSILTVTSMSIQGGSYNGTFRIGVDTSIAVQRVIIKFTHSATGYIPVRAIYLWIQRNKNITISVSDVTEVPAGGRSAVQSVTMSNGPYKPLTFSFHLLKNLPLYSNIYPENITLSSGDRVGKFWISCGKDTKGAIGQLLTVISGDDKSTFQLSNRVREFSVVNPDTILPFISKAVIVSVQETSVVLLIQASEAFTLYYAVTPTFMREVTFEQIKLKMIPYDYFNHTFILGEYVEDSSSYEYQFTIDGLEKAQLYLFTGYVEDFSGNLATSNISLTFNTTGYTSPFTSDLDVQGTANVSAPTNNSLLITGISGTGTLYGIALRYPTKILQNHFGADTSVIRNRLLADTTDSSNSSIDTISSNPYVPETSNYNCETTRMNYLSVKCSPIVNMTFNSSRIDYYSTTKIVKPNGQQIYNGENYEGILIANHVNGTSSLLFENLIQDSDYYIFIASELEGKYSENVLETKGTTRVLFILSNLMIRSLILIILILI